MQRTSSTTSGQFDMGSGNQGRSRRLSASGGSMSWGPPEPDGADGTKSGELLDDDEKDQLAGKGGRAARGEGAFTSGHRRGAQIQGAQMQTCSVGMTAFHAVPVCDCINLLF